MMRVRSSISSPGIQAKINLIPFNPWPGSKYECSDWKQIEKFSEIIFNAGYSSPVRTPRGRDILAACGQLKSETEKSVGARTHGAARHVDDGVNFILLLRARPQAERRARVAGVSTPRPPPSRRALTRPLQDAGGEAVVRFIWSHE